MRRLLNVFMLLAFVVNTSGCATILKSKETRMKVTSEPEGAEVYQSFEPWMWRKGGEVRVGRTPTEVTLSNKHEAELIFRKDGYEETMYRATPHVHHGWMLASFVCAVMPAFIDLVSRNAYSFKEKEIKVTLDSADPKSARGVNADEILKWKQLLDSGAISQEEYAQKKKQLLGGV